ncbi:MAG: glutamate--tRNA ligase [Planctomycetota bacterium]|nr:glutamate--tRNA ligase [Planctomycetota bacterium]
MSAPNKPRLRFAPSPTGQLHIGGARTALFNWAFARRTGGAFVLRVEDTDPTRSKKEYEHAILDGLTRMGIDWDEGPDVGGEYGPYRQTERFDGYLGVAAALFQAGYAYRCFCPSERLEALREAQMAAKENPRYDGCCKALTKEEAQAKISAGEEPVLRFDVPEGETRFTDLIRGEVTFQNAEVDDWIMVRADATPTYNFVVVCDDSDMQITHVLRGEEHLTNTPKQVLLFEALGLDAPIYGHLPLMLGTDGKKLSKRTGDTALIDYLDKGYPPEAILNFLCLQGWALDGEHDLFGVDELIANFEPTDVSKGGSIFDPEKFLWMAGEYVRRDTPERLAERCTPFLVAAGLATLEQLDARKDWLVRAVAAHQERFRLYSELPDWIGYLFADDAGLVWDPKAEKGARKHAAAPETLAAFATWLAARGAAGEALEGADLAEATKAWVAERGLKIPGLFQPLRCALTGAPGGADLFEIIGLLGLDATLARIADAAARLGVPAAS